MLNWFDVDYSSLQLKEIGQWPLMLRIVLVITSCCMIMILMFYFWFAANLEHLTRQKLLLSDKGNELARLQDNLLNLQNIKENIGMLQEQYATHFYTFSKMSMSGLLAYITNLIMANDLQVNSIKVDPAAKLQELYQVFPIKASVRGDYHKSAEFVISILRQLSVQIFSINFCKNILNLEFNVYLEFVNDCNENVRPSNLFKIKYHGENFRNPFTELHIKQSIMDAGVVVGGIKNQQHSYTLLKDQYGVIHMVRKEC